MISKNWKKAAPIIGAFIGAFADTATMNHVIKGTNLIYHKRFLFEKNTRIQLLENIKKKNNKIIDYDEFIE